MFFHVILLISEKIASDNALSEFVLSTSSKLCVQMQHGSFTSRLVQSLNVADTSSKVTLVISKNDGQCDFLFLLATLELCFHSYCQFSNGVTD
jgi:hypothetical protein